MKLKQIFIGLLLVISPAIIRADLQKSKYSSISVTEMQCEYFNSPKGIDVEQPMLSWKLTEIDNTRRGSKQTACQIIISSSSEKAKRGIGDIFLSEKIISGQMRYTLKNLHLIDGNKYWWNVKVWNEDDVPSLLSSPSYWIMGLLNGDKWNAEWITAAGAEKYAMVPQNPRQDIGRKRDFPKSLAISADGDTLNYSSLVAEKDVNVKSKLKSAIIHISGLGQYELTINGKKTGDYKLAPGWTNYNKTVLYDTYDVTEQLKKGNNTLSVILSNGMYNIQPDNVERYVKFLNSYGPLKVIAQLKLEYEDGSIEKIGTDATWRVAPGPVTFSNIYGGEDFDARLIPIKKWYNAIVCKGPGGQLKGLSCSAPAIKEIEILKPISVTKVKPNIFLYDLGQNASLMPRIQVKGNKGAYIRINPAELIQKDSLVDRRSVTQDGVRPAYWQYTLEGKDKESWFPQFFYQGGRYLQVELYPDSKGNLPEVINLEGVVVHASSTPIGTFETSNKLFNKIYSLVRWAQRSNMMSVMTDCPAREKLGWLEETQLNGPALRYNFDMAPFFRKVVNDMSDSQLDFGLVPCISPEYFAATDLIKEPLGNMRISPEWGSALIIVPWQQYLFSGDTYLFERYYDSMKRYVSFLSSLAKDNIVYAGLGDWCDQGPKEPWGWQLTPPEFTATATYFYDNVILSKVAALLHREGDEQIFKLKAEEIRRSFNEKFYHAETGTYCYNSQTSNAMPIAMGIIESQNKKRTLDAIVTDIHDKGNSQTSGDVGYQYLLRALADNGQSELIYEMNNQSEKPGYGYQLKMGATSLAEKWNCGLEGGFGSQNHFMLGQINEWFFHDLLGIANDEMNPGFKNFTINPAIVPDMEWAKGSFNSVSGLISVYWYKKDGKLNLEISVPVNATAKVYIPATSESSVQESNVAASQSKGITFLEKINDKVVYKVESGKYHFTVK